MYNEAKFRYVSKMFFRDAVSNLPSELKSWFNKYLYVPMSTYPAIANQVKGLDEKYINNLETILFPSVSHYLINTTDNLESLILYMQSEYIYYFYNTLKKKLNIFSLHKFIDIISNVNL